MAAGLVLQVAGPLPVEALRSSQPDSEYAGVWLERWEAKPVAAPSAAPGIFERKLLRTHSHTLTSLAQEAGGKRLLVVVAKGNYCPVCLSQILRLERHSARLAQLGARLVGLTVDSPASNQKARKKHGVTSGLLSDASTRVVRALGLWSPEVQHPTPAIVLFDECGSEAGRWMGRYPGHRPDAAVWEKLETLSKNPPRCSASPNT